MTATRAKLFAVSRFLQNKALKEYTKVIDKLCTNRNKKVNMNEQWSKYKIHRDRLNYLIRAVERQYYRDQLIKHKSNLNKSWQNNHKQKQVHTFCLRIKM